MASARINAQNAETVIGAYTIMASHEMILGKGAYGIVYKTTNSRGQDIAAKAVSGKVHPRILKLDVKKLLTLRHENVVTLFDVHNKDDECWMFMEFCGHGDLNDFYTKMKLSLEEKLEIMEGLAKGVSYLHEENIIHRDIKPPNILISCVSPIVPKLADFDLSKSFDPDFETSVMSSNVGTNAFKAPEFFKRVGKKLQYHRNVDLFALGLTFLALVQDRVKSGQLIPQIETARDESEEFMPIGQLIAERVKYKKNPLEIVRITIGKTETSRDRLEHGLKSDVKRLIQKMTCVEAPERLKAAEVQAQLYQIQNQFLSVSGVDLVLPDDTTLHRICSKSTVKEVSYFISTKRLTPTEDQHLLFKPIVVKIMNINVRDTLDRNKVIDVQENASVQSVKEMIARQVGIPSERQALFYNGHPLKANRLSDYNVKSNATLRLSELLTLVVKRTTIESAEQVIIHTHSGATVEDTKKQIEGETGVPVEFQRLLHDGMLLRRSTTLAQNKIVNGARVFLVQKNSEDNVHVIVRFKEKATQLFVNRSDSIQEIKELIYERKGVALEKQSLSFNGVTLGNGRTLGWYGIGQYDRLDLDLVKPESQEGPMYLYVKGRSQEYLTKIFVKPSDTIYELKEKIEELEGIHPDIQFLTDHQSNVYDNVNTLEDQGIKPGDTILMSVTLDPPDMEDVTLTVNHAEDVQVKTVNTLDSVLNFKRLHLKDGFPDFSSVMFEGEKLKESRSLASYGIEHGALIKICRCNHAK